MTATHTEPSTSDSVVEHTNPADWDELVARLGGLAFQSWAWGTLKGQFGWQALRLATPDGDSAAQLLIRPYRGLAVAYVPRGPLSAEPGKLAPELIEAILGRARAQRAAFVRFEPDIYENQPGVDALDGLLRKHGFKVAQQTIQPRSTIRLDLTPADEQLFSSFSEGHRRAVRRAEKAGVLVSGGRSDDDVTALHRMLNATTQRKRFGIHSEAYYRAVCAAFGEHARIFVARLGEEVVSALLALTWGQSGIYVAGGSTGLGLENRASHLLQWHALRWAREQGARHWDSWGIADARGRLELARAHGESLSDNDVARLEADARRDPLDPLFQFKKGLGGEVARLLPAYDRVFIRPAYWLWQRRRGEA